MPNGVPDQGPTVRSQGTDPVQVLYVGAITEAKGNLVLVDACVRLWQQGRRFSLVLIITSGNSNYTKYQQGLEKLKELEVEVYCADHYGYVTGEEAKTFVPKTIEMAKQNRALMEEMYRFTRDIEKTAKKLVSSFYEENPYYFLSPEIYLDVHRQMVRHIANVIEGKTSS